MRQKYVMQAIEEKTFVTKLDQKKEVKPDEAEEEQVRLARLRKEQAIAKNETYKMFDRILGMEPNDEVQATLKEQNPLFRTSSFF